MTRYGLTTSQVEESIREYGENSLTEQTTEGFWKKFLGNLNDPMIKILCVALVINIVFTILGETEWYESLGIALAVLLATLVSTFSEFRNESAFQKLQEEASQINCKVYRDGSITELPIDKIVVNDCVLLQAGDLVPADGILLEGSLMTDQSVLNGETEEAEKVVMPDDYLEADTTFSFMNPYKLYRGSIVVAGNAVMCVSMVGDKSVYGQIAEELQRDDDRDTPLKLKLRSLARGISRFGYIGGVLIAIALLFQRIVILNDFDLVQIGEFCSNWLNVADAVVDALMLAVIIIVMAVPEGLPLMIAIVSALNMGKMLRDNVLVRKLQGIETAGSLNILFSDKTGTITKGQLEAMVFVDGAGQEYRSVDAVTSELQKMLSLSIRHNTSAVFAEDDNKNVRIIGGNATERAILGFVSGVGEFTEVAVVNSIPFDSANKYSATQLKGEHSITLIKGAPEKILANCHSYYNSEGQRVPLADEALINSKIDTLADRAIRVLALATSDGDIVGDVLPEKEWTLVGIIGIRDEIREESVTAIAEVGNAGVQVVMITGDRKDTAVAVAKEAGLITCDSDIVLTSDELSQMDDEQVKSILADIRVISRALPSDKSRLVRIAQELNLVVGMTGDGVNDSPALKAADVGFAMGGGTEIAKEASEIIIMDDNFSSIDKAILYGRTIFNSIRKFIIFQLTINVSAVLICFIMPLVGRENPLTITQILWVNLVMDTLAALAFGGEPALKRFMKEKPKRREENIVSSAMWTSILTDGFCIFILSLVFLLVPFMAGLFRPSPEHYFLLTGYFTFFIFAAVFNAFNARTDQLNLFDHILENKGFINIILLIVAVQIIMTYFGGPILNGFGLTLPEWGVVLLCAFLIIPVDLIRKAIIKTLGKN